MTKQIRITLGSIETIYTIEDNEGYCDIVIDFCEHNNVEDSSEMTVTEVGGFYDKNRFYGGALNADNND